MPEQVYFSKYCGAAQSDRYLVLPQYSPQPPSPSSSLQLDEDAMPAGLALDEDAMPAGWHSRKSSKVSSRYCLPRVSRLPHIYCQKSLGEAARAVVQEICGDSGWARPERCIPSSLFRGRSTRKVFELEFSRIEVAGMGNYASACFGIEPHRPQPIVQPVSQQRRRAEEQHHRHPYEECRRRAEEQQRQQEEQRQLAKEADAFIRTRRRFDTTQPLRYLCQLHLIETELRSRIEPRFDNWRGLLAAYEGINFTFSADRQSVRVMHLTPFQGESSHRVFGEFRCPCTKRWKSAGTWKDKWQQCQGCDAKVYPHVQYTLERSSNADREDEGEQERRPHDMSRCQKCREKGSLCMPRMYYAT